MNLLNHKTFVAVALALGLLLGLSGASMAQNISISTAKATEEELSIDDDMDEPAPTRDPLQRFNRAMFRFNDTVYRRLFDPFSRVYDRLVHKQAQACINNFGDFVRTPVRVANNILQSKFKAARTEVIRFGLNGTLGVGGLFDSGKRHFNLPAPVAEDFNQTLGKWNVPAGPYIVLPILGPSDPRNILGTIGDMSLDPVMWAWENNPDDDAIFIGYRFLMNINNYSFSVRDAYGKIIADALDPYIAVRQIYIQNRDKRVKE